MGSVVGRDGWWQEVLGRVHHRYFNFLEGMREWVAAPGDQAQGSAKQLE